MDYPYSQVNIGKKLYDWTWKKIRNKLKAKLLLHAMEESWKCSLDPQERYWRRMAADGKVDRLLLMNAEPSPVGKESEEKKKKGYCFKVAEGDSVEFSYFNERENLTSFELKHELERRYPGTNQDSDDEESVKWELNLNKLKYDADYSPITTAAGQHLVSITFVAPKTGEGDQNRFDLYPCYPMQLTVRTDDYRKFLYYDCLEFKPKWWRPDIDPLPTDKQHDKASDSLRLEGCSPKKSIHPWLNWKPPPCGSDVEYSSEDEDVDDGPPIQLVEVPDVNEMRLRKNNIQLNMHGYSFIDSRMFRIQVPLASVSAAQVHSPVTSGDEEAKSVLILELAQPASGFAVRCVSSNLKGDNKFTTIGDWTPGKVAGRATRHYICGTKEEIDGLVSHLVEISPSLFGMGDENKENASSSKSSNFNVISNISMDAAPLARSMNSLNVPLPVEGIKVKKAKEKILSEEEVNKILTRKCGVEDLDKVSTCLKRAIQLRHVKFWKKGVNTVVRMIYTRYSGFGYPDRCIHCRTKVVVTVADVLYQPDDGGFDPDSEGATFKCPKCKRGMYVSEMCEGKPRLNRGRSHKHCTDCEGFGECLGDYKESHCKDCGEHWFEGNSGFPCNFCGGGIGNGREGVSPAEKPFPEDSTWNGWVEGYTDINQSKDHAYVKNTEEEVSNTLKRKVPVEELPLLRDIRNLPKKFLFSSNDEST